MADHHIPLPTNRHGRGDSAAQAGARRGAARLCSGHLPVLHAASFKVQPRSVSRADPFSGRFRVDMDAGNVLAVATCLHPRDRLTRTSAISGTERETSHARDHQQIIGAANICIQTESSCRRNGSC